MKKIKVILSMLLLAVTTFAFAQNVTISGKVTDSSSGEGLPGASVVVKGTTTGVVTDIDGQYSLTVPSNSVLVFSSIGYKSVERTVGASATVNVALETDTELLDDVIVVAYGTTSRAAFTGSATQVKGSDIAKSSNESVAKGLIGKVAGVRIGTDNGDPGSAASVQIRGVGSVSASTQPLYVVDGVIIDPSMGAGVDVKSVGILNTINPEDIASMTVLKDAAAASLYGSRASNGVIIITTKKGVQGKTTVSYSGEYGVTQVANMKAFDIMDANTFMQWVADSYDGYYHEYAGTPFGYITADYLKENGFFYDPSGKTDTKWQNEVFRNAPTQNHQVSLSGGDQKTQFYAGLGLTKNEGVVLGSSFDRISGRVNLDHQVNDWLKLSFRQMLSFSNSKGYRDQSNQEQGWATTSPTSIIFSMDPTAPVRDENGEFLDWSWSGQVTNPHLMFTEDAHEFFYSEQLRSLSNIDVKIDFTKWLSFTNTFGYDYINNVQDEWWSPNSVNGGSYNGLRQTWVFRTTSLTNSSVLNFNNKWGDHSVSALAGFELSDYYYDNVVASTVDFPTDKLPTLSVGQTNSASGSYSTSFMLSYLASANYDYANKYYVSASFRRDGSSRLGPDSRWANFWSVSGAWRMSNEDFLAGNDLFNDFKLKASYGTNGNLPGSFYAYKGLYSLGAAYGDGAAIFWSSPENNKLGWEKSQNFNAGFEWNMFNRVQLNAEYFHKYTSSLLFSMPASIVTGFSSVTSNIGNLLNSGIEVEVSTINIMSNDFRWDTDFNFSWLKNEIKTLPEGKDISSGDGGMYLLREGLPMYTFNLPVFKGVNPETGLGEFWIDPEDESKGVTNYYSEAGSKILGSALPKFTGGITNTFTYKNFDLSFLISYQFGGHLFDYMEYFTVSDGMRMASFNQLAKGADYWTPNNTDAAYPRPIYNNPYRSDRWSSRHIKSTDNIRVRDIMIGYTIPFQNHIESARVFFKGTNPFMIWSATPDVDPDVPVNGYRTVDVPVTRSFVVGINITL